MSLDDHLAKGGRRGRSRGHGSTQSAVLPNNFKDKSWVHSFAKNEPSPLGDLMDMSPAFALRKLLLLIEKQKYKDASQVINQMNQDTIAGIITDLPIASLIHKIPTSLVLLESIYSKLFLLKSQSFPLEKMGVESMVFQIVKYLSTTETTSLRSAITDDVEKSIKNILRIVLFVEPEIIKVLQGRVELMESAMEGIGEHGLVKLGDSVLNMHDALKEELGRTIASYKSAMHKLDNLSLSHKEPITLEVIFNKRSSLSNHQMLMLFTQDQIQERLFKNKTILNTIEVSLNPQLPHLINALKQRVEYDKNALLAFGRLRREIPTISPDAKVAPIVSQYLKSLKHVVNMMQTLLKEEYPDHLILEHNAAAAERDSAVLDLDDVFQIEADLDTSGLGDSETQEDSSSNGNGFKELPVDVPENPTSLMHGRSRSADRWRSRRRGKKQSRAERLRSLSADRGGGLLISRPEQTEVESNPEFKVMMKRISTVASSSPAVGRRQLERRGISPARKSVASAREGSVSPQLRRHLLGGDASLSVIMQKPVTSMSNITPDYSSWGRADGQNRTSSSNSRPVSVYSEHSSTQLNIDLERERTRREAAEKERDKFLERQKAVQAELDRTKKELHQIKEQLNKQNEEIASRPTSTKPSSSKVDSVRDTLMKFDKLYTTQRHQVWSSLSDSSESLKELEDKEELKDKLLFSVVVLSFRAAKESLHKIKQSVGSMLNIPGAISTNGMNDLSKPGPSEKTEKELFSFLQNLGEKFDMNPMVQEVRLKLNNALRNYSAWNASPTLDEYIKRCVHLAWKLTILQPPLEAHYDVANFNPHFHRRSPGSNPNSTTIKTYLWPSLIETDSTRCVYRGVVST